MKADIKNMTVQELEAFLESLGEKRFRARQVYAWLYKGVDSFDDMTDLSRTLREKLRENAYIETLRTVRVQSSEMDGTRKYLFRLSDGQTIESVFLKYRFGNSACLSSQAGCRMACAFCASAVGGLKRDLSAAEMADQILRIEKDTGERIGSIIIMGTGEPFDNYDNLIRFISLIHAREGLDIGLRSITVSTCGLIPRIRQFAEDMPQVNLAISLHAPNDKIRRTLMPVSASYPMEDLIRAAAAHTERTGRRITFEYALIRDVNDAPAHAAELASRLKGLLCHVNLIPLNEVSEKPFRGSGKARAEAFRAILEAAGIRTTIRREMGADIDAACGQLRLGREK